MTTIPLRSKLHNDVTVSDWLGTAASAARVAAIDIERIREGQRSHTDPEVLRDVEDSLVQALNEVRTVRVHLHRVTNGVQT